MKRARSILTITVAVLVILSGCGMFGGSSSSEESGTSTANSTANETEPGAESEVVTYNSPEDTISDSALLELVEGTAIETQNVSFDYETRVNTADGERIYVTYGSGEHEMVGGVPILHTVTNNHRAIGLVHLSTEEYHTGNSVYRRTGNIDDTLTLTRTELLAETSNITALDGEIEEDDGGAADNQTNATSNTSTGPATERITINSQYVGNVSIQGTPIQNATVSDATVTNDVVRSGIFSNETMNVIVADVSGLGITDLDQNHSWADDQETGEDSHDDRSDTIMGYNEFVLSETSEDEITVERNGDTATLRFETTHVDSIYPFLGQPVPGSQTNESEARVIPVEYQINTSTYEVETFSAEYNTTVETANGTTEAVVTTTVAFDNHGETTVDLPDEILTAESVS